MPKRSAGILMFKVPDGSPRVLLVHPGGPFWAKKDAGAWSIPKGEYEEGDDPLAAALREFEEETGARVEARELLELGAIKLRSGKLVTAWAVEGEFDVSELKSNLFTMEWPPRSGSTREFPEVDRGEWFEPAEAKRRLNAAQGQLVDRLVDILVNTGRIAPPNPEVPS